MITRPRDDRSYDAMIYTTDHGPMIISRNHPQPQLVTDPELLELLFRDGQPTP